MHTKDKTQQRWQSSRKSKHERSYAINLRKIASRIGRIVSSAANFDNPDVVLGIIRKLQRYAETLTEWAQATAKTMLLDVDRSDRTQWRQYSAEMSHAVRKEIESAPVGEVFKQLMADQVTLIKSLPLDAAQRVHDIATQAMIDGTRSQSLHAAIMETGKVAMGRANVIARTETSRAVNTFTQARAQHIGSEGYIWRTSKMPNTRPSHKQMNGVFVRWGAPPTLDNMTGHAGCLPNCNCYPEPIIPEVDDD